MEYVDNFFKVLSVMFAGQFFLNMLDDYLKKKRWLKYRNLKTEDDSASQDSN